MPSAQKLIPPNFWQKAGDALYEGAQNFGPEWLNTVNPKNLPQTIEGLSRLGGLGLTLDKALYDPNYAKDHPKDAALMDALQTHGRLGLSLTGEEPLNGPNYAKYHPEEAAIRDALRTYYGNYGSWHGVSQNVRHHPVGALSDAALAVEMGLAPFTEGASMSVAPLTSGLTLNRVLAIANRAASLTGKATSPFLVPSVAAKVAKPVASRAAGLVMRVPRANIVDSSGTLTSTARKAIVDAFGGKVDPQKVVELHPGLIDDLQKGGVTPANVRQSVARAQGVDLTRSMATGKKPPQAAADITSSAKEKASGDLSSHVESIVPPPTMSIGDSISQAFNASKSNVKNLYDKFKDNKGVIDPNFSGDIMSSIDDRLKNSGLTLGDLSEKHESVIPNAKIGMAEIKRLTDKLNRGEPVGAPQVNDTAKTLNSLWEGSSSYDRELLSAVRKGFYDSIENIPPWKFSDDVKQFASDFKNARGAYEAQANQFLGNDEIARARKLAEAGDTPAATKLISDSLIHPETGEMKPNSDAILDRLHAIGVGDTAERHVAHVAASIVGDPGSSATAVENASTNRFLSPDEADRLALARQTKEIVGQTPTPSNAWTLGRLARTGTGAMIGAGTSAFLGHLGLPPAISVPAFGAIGGALETAVDKRIAGPMERRAEAAGAPVERNVINPSGLTDGKAAPAVRLAKTAANYAARRSEEPYNPQEDGALPIDERMRPPEPQPSQEIAPDADQPPAEPVKDPRMAAPPGSDNDVITPDQPEPHFGGGRVGRASGGKVHNVRRHEYLVDRLLKAAKDAKKMTDKTTEPLLNVPDEHIVKALDVAQRAI